MKNSLFGVATRAVGGFSRIGILLLIARTYGPSLFGRVALAMSLMEIFRSFSEFGLDTVALRGFSRATSSADRTQLLGRVVTTKVISAIIFYFLSMAFVAALAHDRVEVGLGAIASLSLFSANLIGAMTSYYQGQLRMPEIFSVTVAAYLMYILVSVAAIRVHSSLYLVLAILPAAELVYFLMLRARDSSTTNLAWDSSATFLLLKESLPLGMMSAMILLYLRLDNVIIYKLMGSAALGLYAACFRMVEPVLMVPGAFSTTLLTLLSGKPDEHPSRALLVRLALHTMWPAYIFTFCAAAGLLTFGRLLLERFNPAYVSAYPALRILALCLLIRMVNITLTAIISARGSYYTLTKISSANLAVNIVLVLMLVPTLGLSGAAWAACGTEFFNMIAQLRSAGSLVSKSADKRVYELVSLEPECE